MNDQELYEKLLEIASASCPHDCDYGYQYEHESVPYGDGFASFTDAYPCERCAGKVDEALEVLNGVEVAA